MKKKNIYLFLALVLLVAAAVFIFIPRPEDDFLFVIISLVLLVITFALLRLHSKSLKDDNSYQDKKEFFDYMKNHTKDPRILLDYILQDFKNNELDSKFLSKISGLSSGGFYKKDDYYAFGLESKSKNIIVEIEKESFKIQKGDKIEEYHFEKEEINDASKLYELIINSFN